MSSPEEASARALAGGPERHREKARAQGKLPVRERVARLLDPGTFHEYGALAGAVKYENDKMVEFRLPRHIFLPLLLRFLVAQASACVLTMFQTHPQP